MIGIIIAIVWLCILSILTTICLYVLIGIIVENNRLKSDLSNSNENVLRMKRKLKDANLINKKVMIRLAITDRAYINSEMNEWTSKNWDRLDMDSEE